MQIFDVDSRGKSSRWLKGLWLAILMTLFTRLFLVFHAIPPIEGFAAPRHEPAAPSSKDRPLFREQLIPNGMTREVHCATVVEISGGRLLAFWYGGSDEVEPDVCIYSAVFDPGNGKWSDERALISRKDTQNDLGRYIKSLGNPVVLRDNDGKLWLFYVSISLGGWSGSAINWTTSTDEGKTWTPSRRFITSPCFNLSTLVKGTPFLFEDGTIGVPVYHEFINKFGEILQLDRDGNVMRKIRLSSGRYSLQPVIVPVTQKIGMGFMRYCGDGSPRLLMVRTTDGGRTWSRPEMLSIPNPNAAVTSVRLEDGAILLVHNNHEDLRCDMTLSYSDDNGGTWRTIHEFENTQGKECEKKSKGFSYPYIIRARSGIFHLLYSWNSSHIKHVQFNGEWVKGRK